MAHPNSQQRRRDGFDVDALLTTEDQVITVTGATTTPVKIGRGSKFDVSLVAKTISGTSPTLDCTVQCASDLAFTTPLTAAIFEQIDDSADPVEKRRSVTATETFVRLNWVVTGTTPSFTVTAAIRS